MFAEHNLLGIEFETRFFVAVDPAAGGEKSDFAVVSFLVYRGIYQVRACFRAVCLRFIFRCF